MHAVMPTSAFPRGAKGCTVVTGTTEMGVGMGRRHRNVVGAVGCDVGRGELIDVDGAWWQGFYQGWRDRDGDRGPGCCEDGTTLWSVGYWAGWAAAGAERRCVARRWPQPAVTGEARPH